MEIGTMVTTRIRGRRSCTHIAGTTVEGKYLITDSRSGEIVEKNIQDLKILNNHDKYQPPKFYVGDRVVILEKYYEKDAPLKTGVIYDISESGYILFISLDNGDEIKWGTNSIIRVPKSDEYYKKQFDKSLTEIMKLFNNFEKEDFQNFLEILNNLYKASQLIEAQ